MGTITEQWHGKAIKIITIPGFESNETMTVKLKRPNLPQMAAQGKIPNPLLSAIMDRIPGVPKDHKSKDDTPALTKSGQVLEFYCKASMVEPTYEEVQDIITDDQMYAIMDWCLTGVVQLNSFRTDKANGTSNNDGRALPEKAK
ncbi:MAG: hypothetical protein QME45_04365 [Clostridiales bacterium]|nr:hypothetical protein [Clostridiales bacterium]